jgi:hypothetical protein
MSTAAQIEANRQNAQSSTGPTSEAGKQRSSQNAVKHGFTGLSLVITPAEHEAYTAHVKAYRAQYKPASHQCEQLVQQLADLDWSLHKINVQEMNTMSLMNAIHDQDDGADPIATAKVIAALTRTLNTLSLYEVRRRRAAKAIRQELEALQNALNEQLAQEPPRPPNSTKLPKKPANPSTRRNLASFVLLSKSSALSTQPGSSAPPTSPKIRPIRNSRTSQQHSSASQSRIGL